MDIGWSSLVAIGCWLVTGGDNEKKQNDSKRVKLSEKIETRGACD